MDTRNLSGKTALVTGAASGIGRATARALSARGADLYLCDVNEDALEELAAEIRGLGRRVMTGRVDVSRPEELAAFAERVHAEAAAVDVLVNNAGVGLGASFLDTTLEDWNWIVGINLNGVFHGCHFFVPQMVRRGRGGHVVNIASMAGYLADGNLAAYSATKFAVMGLSESMRAELARHSIGVTAVCPGIINTDITRASRSRGVLAAEGSRKRVEEAFEKRNYSPERVAEGILEAIADNVAVAPITPEAWTVYYLKRLSPELTARIKGWLSGRALAEATKISAGGGE